MYHSFLEERRERDALGDRHRLDGASRRYHRQASPAWDIKGLILVPLEALPAAYSIHPWPRLHPERLEILENAGQMSHHYVAKDETVADGVADWPWSRVADLCGINH